MAFDDSNKSVESTEMPGFNSAELREINLIDCHAHMELYRKSDVEKEIRKAKNCVRAVFDSMTEYRKAHVHKSWELLKNYFGFIFPTLGYHPNEAKRGNWEKVERVEEFLLDHAKEIVAVGEIGLDFYHATADRERENQLKIFRHFLSIASELELPVVIHAREAEKIAIREVERAGVEAYFHAFAEAELTKSAQDAGYIGISTGIAFIPQVKRVAEKASVERMFVETDSPFMSPFKGMTNNPCNVSVAVRELEKLKSIEADEIMSAVLKNVRDFFGVEL